jgi:pyridoxal phosphate enzyme (YggS family)
VGHLQGNKAGKALSLFAWIHSIDSIELARRIDRLAGEAGTRPTVLIEVNLAGEATKSGVRASDLGAILKSAASLEHVRVAGLMSVPPAPVGSAGAEASRRWFRELRALRDRWRGEGYDLPALSMGMTDDFEVAIEEGATHVRVGRAIFGERPAPRMPGP